MSTHTKRRKEGRDKRYDGKEAKANAEQRALIRAKTGF